LANSFIVVLVAGIAASYRQFKLDNLFVKPAMHIALPATLISLMVSYLISLWASEGNVDVKSIFKIFFLIVLILIVIQSFMGSKSTHYLKNPNDLNNVKKIGAGVLVGFFSGITGLGGGSIMLPLFHNGYRLKYSYATSLSSSVIPLFVLPTVIYYLYQDPTLLVNNGIQTGYVCWSWVLPMVPFIVIFSQLGVKKNHEFPLWLTKVIFAVIIIINIFKILVL
jgi:hypothetical protein